MLTEEDVINSLKGVFDPEVSVNVYDLGLIYEIEIDDQNCINILMTLTSPFCPAGDMIIEDIVGATYSAGAKDVKVKITFQPEWGPDRISDEGKLELGLF